MGELHLGHYWISVAWTTGLLVMTQWILLKRSGEKSQSRPFLTAVGTFTMNCIIQIDDVMLPCLSQNCTVIITLLVIPQECSCEMT